MVNTSTPKPVPGLSILFGFPFSTVSSGMSICREDSKGFSAGQVLGQFGAQYVSEAIGRRYAMFVITTVLLIVCE